VLTFVQMQRAARNAKNDQEKAIQTTAERVSATVAPKVAADTSAEVIKELNTEYGVVIGNLYKEIGVLETQRQNQLGLSQKELALNYVPRVGLMYVGGPFQIWNYGKTKYLFVGLEIRRRSTRLQFGRKVLCSRNWEI
jgi:hypothetical protein